MTPRYRAPSNPGAGPSLSEFTSRSWDVVVVGGGHNGLCAAAYIARGGRSVLVLERNLRLGGACTLERPFDDQGWLVSPCAYLVGLLHPLVIEELGLKSRGYSVDVVDPHLWCPFEDGTSIALWDDDARSAEAVATLAPSDVKGYLAYCALFARMRKALRGGARDTWMGESPGRDEIEARLGNDREAIRVAFEDSIAEVIERYMDDERLHTALHGQGVIGTYAGPRDPGTAAIHLMHSSGIVEGKPGAWGYVRGGMGKVSFALADAAAEAGAVLATGAEVTEIVPGLGVRLDEGELVRARAVVSDADPKRTVALCGHDVPDAFRAKVDSWRTESPVLKINCALSRLPSFSAAATGAGGSEDFSPHRAMVTISRGTQATQDACVASRLGVPTPAWCELYFQSAYDTSVVPRGAHSMSVFAQYVPYALAEGTWDSRREEIADAAIAEIARFAPEVEEAIVDRQVLGPPDIEERIGSTGGHIFHGDCLPDQMWSGRFASRTPVSGLYLCGAGTHPGGSVMAINGRNAAMAVLADLDANRGRH